MPRNEFAFFVREVKRKIKGKNLKDQPSFLKTLQEGWTSFSHKVNLFTLKAKTKSKPKKRK